MSKLDFNTVLAISIHDMKNSLNTVLTALDDLLEDADSSPVDTPERLAQLRYEARRVNDNLMQLLTLYRNAHGLYTPRFSPVVISELLEEHWLGYRPMLAQKGISCRVDCDPELLWTLERGLIDSLLDNVINNTVRYTQSRIAITAREERGWLVIQVDDDGPGFPHHMLGRRALEESEPPDAAQGRTGLGLYFCALVADLHADEQHRGYVELTNQGDLGGGCFTLRLPPVPL
ncbi:sensor histidine kinase [Ectothiorhodospira mobilis]|uniref:sensor histidine kinase n=1 Tax=Ectothiorhodospira mobilis TaxID=195064 RepID=UPI001EE95B31|nr:HAMP domain-containing sensor histidine kinase [Ectothiorhodospira mobilis]MCG5534839.1 HAMP domain-containing histidine kinase [Ectothiorhodospira mobilis]